MKASLLGLVLAIAGVNASATTIPGNVLDKCNEPKALAQIEKAIVADVRTGSSAFSFHFTPIYRQKDAADLTVYYEQVDGDVGEIRTAHAVQYNINEKTCKPTKSVKDQVLYPENDRTPPSSPFPESCNEGQKRQDVLEAIKKYLTELDSHILPGDTLSNFSFTSMWRIPGSGDMVAYWEAGKPGRMTNPYIATVNVDPKTCKIDVRGETSFTWLLITY